VGRIELAGPFLSKRDRLAHERNNIDVNTMAGGIALNLAGCLKMKGYRAVPVVIVIWDLFGIWCREDSRRSNEISEFKNQFTRWISQDLYHKSIKNEN
jgi:hypothetical protein